MTDVKLERRRFPRIAARHVVSFRVEKVIAGYDISQSRDLGQGGVMLMTNKPYCRGTPLELSIRLPWLKHPVDLKGKVISSKGLVPHLIYETRVQFAEPVIKPVEPLCTVAEPKSEGY